MVVAVVPRYALSLLEQSSTVAASTLHIELLVQPLYHVLHVHADEELPQDIIALVSLTLL
jgi:hypothetical protein